MLVGRTWIAAIGLIVVVALAAVAQDTCSVPDGADAAWALPRTSAALGSGAMALAAARADVTNVRIDAAPVTCIPERVSLDTAQLIAPARPPRNVTIAWMRPRSVSAFGCDLISAPEGTVIRWR